jgi:hypothetical protein
MNNSQNQIISYLTLRTLIGLIGILLPILLPLGLLAFGDNTPIENSISDYYGTIMRNVFVGFLFVLGFYLFSYKGYDNDTIYANLGGFFALGTALFPVVSENNSIKILHLISASSLFIVFAYFSLVIFRRGVSPEQQTTMKKKRNKIYLICGILIILGIAFGGLTLVINKPMSYEYNLLFWGETLALWAFGYSWLVKGELFWKDLKTEN